MSSCILIRYRFTNERHSYSIGTIGLPRLARLLTLIGSCRIYYVLKIKARSPFSILFLKVQFAEEKRSYYHQNKNSLKHCSKHASPVERCTSVDDWRSGKSPATKDNQFYWTCILTDFICGFGWQTHPTRKAESLPWAENYLFKTPFHYFTIKLWCTLSHS